MLISCEQPTDSPKLGTQEQHIGDETYTVATPTASPGASTVAPNQPVTLSTTTPDATIHYTVNGDNPTDMSPSYSTPISITAAMTIKAIAVKEDWNDSAMLTAAYTVDATIPLAPTFNVVAGTYHEEKTVTITGVTDGSVKYTLDGKNPATEGTPYSTPVTIDGTKTLRAVTVKGDKTSAVQEAAYILTPVKPTVIPGAGTYPAAQSVTLSTTTPGATIYYTLNGSEPTKDNGTSGTSVTVSSTSALKAVAVKTNWTNSEVLTAEYTITTASNDGGAITAILQSVIADGTAADNEDSTASFSPTTKLTLTFSEDVAGLSAGDIEIDPNEGTVAKGAVKPIGSRQYELEVDALFDEGPNGAMAVTVTVGETTENATLYAWIAIPDKTAFAKIGDDEGSPLDGWYKQTANIDIEGTWKPIGGPASNAGDAKTTGFRGTFDGDGYKIKPDAISYGDGDFAFFGAVYDATFKNIHVDTGSITVTNGTLGGIANGCYGSSAKGTSFTDCSNAATLTATKSIGGISYNSIDFVSFLGCWNTGNITASSGNSGGIVGTLMVNTGVNYIIPIKNCFNSGNVTVETNAATGTMSAGGIVGSSATDSIIACYNTGNVSVTGGKSAYIGGIAGDHGINAHIIACYNTGNVTSSAAQQSGGVIYIGGIGGFIARGTAVITASYSIGTPSYSGTSGSGATVLVGGISGYNMFATPDTPQSPAITGCYWKDVGSLHGIGAKRPNASTTPANSSASNEGTIKFADGAWPNTTASTEWGIGDGSGSEKYWKSLGEWNGVTSAYPKLWFEN